MMPVYLLHFSRPYRHCRHYVGLTKDLDELRRRVGDHRAGRSTGLLKAATSCGIDLILARVWEDGDREKEVRLKKSLGAAKFCPICKLEARYGLPSHTDSNRVTPLRPAPTPVAAGMGAYLAATPPICPECSEVRCECPAPAMLGGRVLAGPEDLPF